MDESVQRAKEGKVSTIPLTEQRRVALSSISVMFGFVASKLIGIVRQSIIARTFGAGEQLDAYYAAFRLPELLLTLVAGGAIATTFIPVFADHLTRGDTRRAWRLASAVLNILLIVVSLAALGGAISAPWLVRHVIAPGFSAERQDLTADLLRIVLVSSVLFTASSLVMSVLQAHGRFLLPALADFFYDVGIICGALVLAPRMGIQGLAIGVVIGALFHLLIQVPGLLRVRARYVPVLRTGDRDMLRFGRLMGPRIGILAMFQIVFLFTTRVASRLEGGSITAITMGWTMVQMPEVIFAMAIATAAFPTMSALVTSRDQQALEDTVSGALQAILALTLPSAVALLLLGRSYIDVLFRSSAFDARAGEMIYRATAAFTVGLIGHAVLELAARLFYAHQNTLIPFWIALGATALNIGLCLLLSSWMGQAGLALANSIVVSLQSAVLLWMGWRSRVRFDWGPVWRLLGRATLASVAMAGSIWLVVSRQETLGSLWTAIIGSTAGGGVYLGTFGILSRREARSVVRALLKRV